MAAVVNLLTFTDPVDRELFAGSQPELAARMRAIDGFRAFEVIQTSEREVILIIRADSVEVLDRIASEVGSPWMREHVVPLLHGRPQRHVGDTIASS